ncbi:hypothetical protein [Paracoccus spongiarum]|uniref:Uncharacterized protein n=1 Tax=Paracoccus spongiarum TaxID=3064387 RepID=A0ABT9JGA6_9RHOB|nr:hypothetical protein [Paracoccus sp. 2205BS29-5]MDP5308842.1 hypothetical protein [Paracoccus sp. 2205BS29-5]
MGRTDPMIWVQRLVAGVFLVGLAALVMAVVGLLRMSEGVPPLPVYAGVVGIAALILLAGACLALISIALSARRGAEALARLAGQGGAAQRGVAAAASREAPKEAMAAVPVAPARPLRAPGRGLVAER